MTTEFDIKLGVRLKELRLYHGYTQQAVGEVLGVSFQQVQKYEAGSNRVTARTLHALRSLYSIRWDDFFFRLDIPALPAMPTPDLEKNITITVILAPPQDPNKSHPLGRDDVIKVLAKNQVTLNSNGLDAIFWKYHLKDTSKHKHKYAWKSDRKASAWCYTSEVINFIKKLSPQEISDAKAEYNKRNSKQKAP